MSQAKRKEPADIKGTKLEPKGKMKPKANTVKKLHVNRFHVAEYSRQVWHIIPDAEHTIEDLLRTEYWAHTCSKMSINDHIEAIWDDGNTYAEFKVLNKGDTWAKVALIHKADLSKSDAEAPEKKEMFEVKWRGPRLKWAVERLSDGERLSSEHNDKETAAEWLVEHKKTQ